MRNMTDAVWSHSALEGKTGYGFSILGRLFGVTMSGKKVTGIFTAKGDKVRFIGK